MRTSRRSAVFARRHVRHDRACPRRAMFITRTPPAPRVPPPRSLAPWGDVSLPGEGTPLYAGKPRGGDASKSAALSGLEHTSAEASSVVGRTRAVDAEASSCHSRKPGNMARKSGGLHAPVLAIPSWAVHAVGYRTADRLSGLFPQCYHVACRITRDAPRSDVALLARDWPLVAANAR